MLELQAGFAKENKFLLQTLGDMKDETEREVSREKVRRYKQCIVQQRY